ncbi:Protein-tyrosine-phosphatase PTP1, partial [Bienertia sinuspersici]
FFRVLNKRTRPSDMTILCKVALDPANLNKNRYIGVIPFDGTRVVLTSCKDYRPTSKGYINASFIEVKNGPQEFGDIFVVTKWIKTTESSLVLRYLEATKAE